MRVKQSDFMKINLVLGKRLNVWPTRMSRNCKVSPNPICDHNVITIWSSVFGLTNANWILMQLKVSMLQLELKVKYWWWCTDESLLYCQCSCYFQFNTIKSLIVNYLTWVMCSPYHSPAPRGAQPGPRGEPPGPGGGRWCLLRVSHQGSPLCLQSHLETQCKTVFLYP